MSALTPFNIRIATRKSPLAMWQANYVKTLLIAFHPHITVDILGLLTEGDKLLATPLTQIGGKGLFVKELEKAILEHRADIAVHSIKDLPVTLPDHLILAAVCEREDPRDALVSNQFTSLDDLPQGAIVGTSSSRRACQLHAIRPDLKIENLRGNVGTRLSRLDAGLYDAIILAAAGLKRLEVENRIRAYLDPEIWIPAVGQGAIGIECHRDNASVLNLLTALNHPPTQQCITAERSMNLELNGGCQLPIAGYATLQIEQLTIRGLVGDLENQTLIQSEASGSIEDAANIGAELAHKLLAAGARALLQKSTIS
ncbi:MAG TPA: hydroxymethylbilane synthase [Gammaproteobacteria bacterium]|nr:hydroxymethylbilane synthase [Gammaproteobacteria bacterium]